MDVELAGSIALARTLSRYWKRNDTLLQEPRFVFLTNPSDGKGDVYAQMHRAATEQLVRIWRDESEVDVAHGRRRQVEWGNQIVRFANTEPENIRFTAGHAARILLKESKIREVTLYVPTNIGEATGSRKAMPGVSENITGLHLGKVALITGGSAGIGGQVARLLGPRGGQGHDGGTARKRACAVARARIVSELEDIGFAGVERRVQTLANVDVSNFESLKGAVDATINAFGRIDYLINNAGVAGAEDMVVDMGVDAWNYTLDCQSHLQLFPDPPCRAADEAARIGLYPQRLVLLRRREISCRRLPQSRRLCGVEGGPARDGRDRWRAISGRRCSSTRLRRGRSMASDWRGPAASPALFERRGKLILENKRLNAVHAASVKALRRGVRVEALLTRLARNDTVRMSHDTNNPRVKSAILRCPAHVRATVSAPGTNIC